MDFMKELLGSSWAYYIAFGILIVWWTIERAGKR